MANIEHKDQLLQQIAAGLNQAEDTRLGCLEVVFKDGDNSYEFGVAQALDVLAEDLYWDERGNWSKATQAEVRRL